MLTPITSAGAHTLSPKCAAIIREFESAWVRGENPVLTECLRLIADAQERLNLLHELVLDLLHSIAADDAGDLGNIRVDPWARAKKV